MPSDTESVTHHSVQSDPDLDNAKHKAQHRARMRRHRARRGKGTECLVIRVTRRDRFQAAGYLDRADRGDPAAEARAIECFITDYLP
jgi:hypothetical protein